MSSNWLLGILANRFAILANMPYVRYNPARWPIVAATRSDTMPRHIRGCQGWGP